MFVKGLKNNIDEKLAQHFVTKYCAMHDSPQYTRAIIKDSAVSALRIAYAKNRNYANTALQTLRKKYPEEGFPTSLE